MRKGIIGGIIAVLLVLSAIAVSADVVINEVMYNPTADQGGNDYGEWIEIHNIGSTSVDMSSWKLCGDSLKKGYIAHNDSNIYLNTSFILASGQYALITDGGSGTDVYNNLTVDSSALALHVTPSTLCNGGLSTSGEVINVTNATYATFFDYTPYISLANGDGKTLERYNFVLDNWNESKAVNGTPGTRNSIYDDQKPIANFTMTPSSLFERGVVLLNATLSRDNAGITNYVWEFGDGNVTSGSSLSEISHNYNALGEYTIKLTVYDEAKFNDSMSKSFNVYPYLDIVNITLDGAAVNDNDTIYNKKAGDVVAIGFELFNRYSKRLYGVNGTLENPFYKNSTLTYSPVDAGSLLANSFQFKIPYLGFDNFELNITSDGRNSSGVEFSSIKRLYFAINKSIEHRVVISDKAFSRDNLTCDKNTVLDVTIVNVGQNDETVKVEVKANGISLSDTKSILVDSQAVYSFPINAKNLTSDTTFTINVSNPTFVYFDPFQKSIGLKVFGACFNKTGLEAGINVTEDVLPTFNLNLTTYTHGYENGWTYNIENQNTSIIICTISSGTMFSCGMPAANVSGTSAVNMSITAGATVNYALFDVLIKPVNDEPVLTLPALPATINEDELFSFNATGFDVDGDALTFGVNSTLNHLSYNGTVETYSWMPGNNDVGTHSFNVTLDDGGALVSQVFNIQVLDANDAPALIVEDQTYSENATKLFYINAEDIDPTVQVLTIGTNATFGGDFNFSQINFTNTNAYAIFNWTPQNADVGAHAVMFNVTDGINVTSKVITITVTNVNNAPVLDFIDNKTVNEDNALSFVISALDIDGDALTFGTNYTGIISIASINSTHANISWTPTQQYVGNNSVLFTVNDGLATDSQIVNIEVTGVNDAPEIQAITDKQITASEAFSFTVNVTDEENDLITYDIKQGTGNMSISSLGVFTWTPQIGDIGVHNITVNVSDSDKTDEENFTITVIEPVNVENVKIKINGGSFENLAEGGLKIIRPGDYVYLQLDIANKFISSSIHGAEVNATIKDVDGQDMTAIDGPSGSITAGSSATLELPLGQVDEDASANYDFVIKVTGVDDDDNAVEDTWAATIKAQSDSHQIVITSKDIDKPSVVCNRSVVVTATVKNINHVTVPEDVRVRVHNPTLGINEATSYVSIAKGSSHLFSIPINISKDKPAGKYNLTVIAESSDASDTESVELDVQSCSIIYSPAEQTIYIANSADQHFSVTLPSGFDVESTTWKLLNESGSHVVSTLTSYTYQAENKDGLKTRKVQLEVKAKDGYTENREWTIKATSYPLSNIFTTSPSLAGLNDSVLQNINLTLNMPGVAKIEFLHPLDLRNVVLIDQDVNATDSIVAFDSTSIFTGPARITLYGLEYDEEPKIYCSNGFTTTPSDINDDSCMGLYAFIEYRTNPPTTNGEVRFNATISSSFRVGTISAPPSPLNAPNAAASASPSTAAIGQTVTLSAASSTGATPLSYSWSAPSGITLSSATSASPTFTAPSTTGTYTFTVTVSNSYGSDTDTVTVTVGTTSGAIGNLTISDLDIDVGGEDDKDVQNGEKISEKAKPGDKVKFDIEVENVFPSSSDIEMQDITVTITIKDIDDGDDLEEDADIDDLDAGDEDSAVIEFDIPTLVKDGTYDVIILVEGEDENGGDHSVRWELTLEVKKEKHELLIDDSELSPSVVRCSRNAALDLRVVNIGREDEDDVTIEISNSELGIDAGEEGIELAEGDDEDSVFENTYRFAIDDDATPGTYPITIKAYYDSKVSDQKTVNLVVEDCVDIVTPIGAEPVEIITQPSAMTKPAAPVTKISFRETSEYVTLLTILFVILAGGVIFLIGAAIIIYKR